MRCRIINSSAKKKGKKTVVFEQKFAGRTTKVNESRSESITGEYRLRNFSHGIMLIARLLRREITDAAAAAPEKVTDIYNSALVGVYVIGGI